MQKTIIISVLILALAFPVLAQNTGDSNSNEFEIRFRESTEAFREDAAQLRQTTQQNIEQLRKQFQSSKDETVQLFLQNREQALEQLKQKRDEFLGKVQEARQTLQEKLREKRNELKQELENVKDQAKRRIAEHIYDVINALNERITNQLIAALTQIEEVLSRIESRADKAEANSIEVSVVRTAISAAQIAIQDARDAVEEQAGKVYSFDVNTDETLRFDVGEARQKLHDDLERVREIVKSARDAVHNAAVALGQITRVDEAEVEANGSNQDDTNATE